MFFLGSNRRTFGVQGVPKRSEPPKRRGQGPRAAMLLQERTFRPKVPRAWSCATVLMLAATLFALQTDEVSAETYDFTFSGTSSAGGAAGSILGGVITGSGGIITSISGTASGMSSVLTNGYFNYLGSDARFNLNSNKFYFYNTSSDYSFYLQLGGPDYQKMTLDSRGGYSNVQSLPTGTLIFSGNAVVTLRGAAVAAPEIDGSVVPRAAFVMMGLFWIFRSRQRRLRLAEA